MIGIILALVSNFIAAFGAIALKIGATKGSTYHIISGLFLSGTAVLIFIIALRWEYLSLLYSIGATSYISVTYLAVKILKEKMTRMKWIGISLIIMGIIIVGLS